MGLGQKLQNLWVDIKRIPNSSKERTGYATQKPIELYKRIIEMTTNPGDVVLEPYAGSGTTLIASEILDRKWIGSDHWHSKSEHAYEHIRKRFNESAFRHRHNNTISKNGAVR